MARSTIGCVEAALSCFQAATTLSVSWLLSTEGSYAGWLTRARISPVRGVEGDDGAALVAQRLVGGGLGLGVDGELEARAGLAPCR